MDCWINAWINEQIDNGQIDRYLDRWIVGLMHEQMDR